MEKHNKSNKIESGKEQAVKMHANTEKQSIKREIQKLAEKLGPLRASGKVTSNRCK
jgi:hypothetical protein